jgi:hypothetical protein
LFLIAGVLQAQSTTPQVSNPLGGTSRPKPPTISIFGARQPRTAPKNGADLAQQLEEPLDETPFDIATLSREPEGDQPDGLSAAKSGFIRVPACAGTPLQPAQSGAGNDSSPLSRYGTYSLHVEIYAHVMTSDYEDFLAIQQELLAAIITGRGTCRHCIGRAVSGRRYQSRRLASQTISSRKND